MAKNKYFEDWIKTLSKQSKASYRSGWSILTEYYRDVKKEEITPDILLERLIEDRKKPLEKQGAIEKELNAWLKWLEHDYIKRVRGANGGKTGVKGVSASSIKLYIYSVKSFFSFYGYPLSKKVKLPRHIKMNNGKIENIKIEYRPEQVKKLLDVIRSPRDKALVLLMFQSGMDISTALSLNYGHIQEGLEGGNEPLMIHVNRPKVGLNYRTFVGHDAVEALKLYMNQRKVKYKEEIGYDTPLFVSDGTHINKRKRIVPKNFQDNMREYVLLAGLVTEERLKRSDLSPARPHALRAGFSTIARLKGLNEKLIDYFMGHSDSYGGAYNIVTNDELKEKYIEIEPGLSVSSVSNLGDIEVKMKEELELRDHMIRGMKEEILDLKQGAKIFNEVFKEMAEIPELKETLAKHFGK